MRSPLAGERDGLLRRALGRAGIGHTLVDRKAGEDPAAGRLVVVVDHFEGAREEELRVGPRHSRKRRPSGSGRPHDLQRQLVVVGDEREPHGVLQTLDTVGISGKLLRLGELGEERAAVGGFTHVFDRELEPLHRRARFEHTQRFPARDPGVAQDLLLHVDARCRTPVRGKERRRRAATLERARNTPMAVGPLVGGEIGGKRACANNWCANR